MSISPYVVVAIVSKSTLSIYIHTRMYTRLERKMNAITWAKLVQANKFVTRDRTVFGTQQKGDMHLCQIEFGYRQTFSL